MNYEHFVIFRHWDLMMPNELIMKPSRVRKVFIPYTSQAFLKQSSMKLKDRWYGASLMSLHKYCDSVQSNQILRSHTLYEEKDRLYIIVWPRAPSKNIVNFNLLIHKLFVTWSLDLLIFWFSSSSSALGVWPFLEAGSSLNLQTRPRMIITLPAPDIIQQHLLWICNH